VTAEERIEVLRELVEEQQAELHDAVEELEVAARRTLDARSWIRQRPFVWTAGAFAVGAWLGGRKKW
jgi:hypothetical protein